MADDPYEILGVPHTATDEQIRKAYLKLVKELHPDVNPYKTAEERFKKVTAAHDILGDPERRRQEPAGEAAAEFLHQVVQVARDLGANALRAGAVGLDQVVRADRDGAVLLLDGDEPAEPVRHDEVDLAVQRGARVRACPVDAVVDGVLAGQLAFEHFERLELTGRVAPASGRVDLVGNDLGHDRVWMARAASSPMP